ncbi:AraC family transcriptional regulator [Paludibacterium sp. B53371]|uniref:helix-turn-helix transcriptional regulator n=1 Tax=Paludibacterium sp. B53371 TaxID=2806263 RepID=UPI001C05AFBF|nr:AraC family transcriptional regulator [Paludibacterium sp. B53371]
MMIPVETRLSDGRPMLIRNQAHPVGADMYLHCHPEGQLWALWQGGVTIELQGCQWVLPQGQIGWLPPGTPHASSVFRQAVGWHAYLQPALCEVFPPTPTVFRASPLIRAMLAQIADWQIAAAGLSERQQRFFAVLLDELLQAGTQPLMLPMPSHPGLLHLARGLLEDPAQAHPLDTLAREAGLSPRSLTRHFRQQTGMTLVQWRTAARMKKALEGLAAGGSVTRVAFETGYDSVSSFITAFRQRFGVTPARYVQGMGK